MKYINILQPVYRLIFSIQFFFKKPTIKATSHYIVISDNVGKPWIPEKNNILFYGNFECVKNVIQVFDVIY